MKVARTTIGLTVVLLTLGGWRSYQWQVRTRTTPRGFPIMLAYPCSYPESFNVLGDDRQVVAHYKSDGKLSINEIPFSESDIGFEMEKIFETRNYKLVWINAEPQVSYGEAVQAIASLQSDQTKAIIAMATASQLASTSVDAHGFPVSFCPYPSTPQPH